jgi:hypothetical protein
MRDDYEKQLEAAVRRELDALPELAAPAGLGERVLRRIQQQAAPAPWYRRAWPAWPVALRVTSLCMLIAGFAAISVAVLQIPHTGLFASVSSSLSDMLDRLAVIGRTFDVVVNSLKLALGGLSALHVAVLAMVGAVCYAVCVGVGTVYYRLAFVQR